MASARSVVSWLALAAAVGPAWAALEVDFDQPASILAAAKLKAYDVMSYYKGNLSGEVLGVLPGPPPNGDYYWWESGALWGTMVDYWHVTDDATYNDNVVEGLQAQSGMPDNAAFLPVNWSATVGNDDQAFWGMSALLAAEVGFASPAAAADPSWLALAQGVFDSQAARIDSKTCGGGLRWQIGFANNGYDYKNAMSNGAFFNLGARLARYTGNQSYADAAVQAWDWLAAVGLLDEYHVYDGTFVTSNCSSINKAEFSYASAVILQGAAFMYNKTEDDTWKTRVDGMVDTTLSVFFPDGIAVELACEDDDQCTTDMISFKGYTHRWLAVTAQLAPFTHARISKVLRSSAEAAVKQCTGGKSGRVCGYHWASGKYDDTDGAGQEMNTLAALLSVLVDDTSAPGTASTASNSTGDGSSSSGNSTGDASQGGSGSDSGSDSGSGSNQTNSTDSTTSGAGRERAGFLPVMFIAGCLGLLSLAI